MYGCPIRLIRRSVCAVLQKSISEEGKGKALPIASVCPGQALSSPWESRKTSEENRDVGGEPSESRHSRQSFLLSQE